LNNRAEVSHQPMRRRERRMDGSNHRDQCSDFCLFTMPSTINSICSAIWCLAELSIKLAPEHSLQGSKLCLLDLVFRQHISFI
jgi:hypothetical protein